MGILRSSTYRLFIHIVTYFVIISFLSQDLARAQGPSSFGTPKSSEPNFKNLIPSVSDFIPAVSELRIPENTGKIQARYQGNNGKLVIHIQDSHAHYEAQTNYAKILQELTKEQLNGGKKLLAVEGASGPLTVLRFRAIPDEHIKKTVSDYFLKNAFLNGAEYFSIFASDDVVLCGVEDKEIYNESLEVFRCVQQDKKEAADYLSLLGKKLEGLITSVYPDEISPKIKKLHAYHKDESSLAEYIKTIRELVLLAGVPLNDYKNFKAATECAEQENRLDLKKVSNERDEFIKELQKVLVKEELQELATKSLLFRMGRIDSAEYYIFLEKLITEPARYKNLYEYIQVVKKFADVNTNALFGECERLEKEIGDKLFLDEKQKELYRLLKGTVVVGRLVELKMSRDDLRYYREHREELQILRLEKDAGRLGLLSQSDGSRRLSAEGGSARGGQPANRVPSLSTQPEGCGYLPLYERFYTLAEKRDSVLLENTLKKMDEEGVTTAFLVTGGFHTAGITEELARQNISYLVVSPRITNFKTGDTYLGLMMNVKTPFERLIEYSGKRLANPSTITDPVSLRRPDLLRLLNELILAQFLNGTYSKSGR